MLAFRREFPASLTLCRPRRPKGAVKHSAHRRLVGPRRPEPRYAVTRREGVSPAHLIVSEKTEATQFSMFLVRASAERALFGASGRSAFRLLRAHEGTAEVSLGGQIVVGAASQVDVLDTVWSTASVRLLVMELDGGRGGATPPPLVNESATAPVALPHRAAQRSGQAASLDRGRV